MDANYIEMEGWLFKRSPKTSDHDKSVFRRMFNFSSQRWRRRYFVLNQENGTIRYYDKPLDAGPSEALGVLDLTTVASVVEGYQTSEEDGGSEEEDEDGSPTPFVFSIVTTHRVYVLAAETKKDFDKWRQVLGSMMDEDDTARRQTASVRLSVPFVNNPINNNNAEDGDQQPPTPTPRDGSSSTVDSAVSGVRKSGGSSSAKRGGNLGEQMSTVEQKHASFASVEEEKDRKEASKKRRGTVNMKNIQRQTREIEEISGSLNHVTGNLPVSFLSFLSSFDFYSLSFVSLLMETCDHPDPMAFLNEVFLDRVAFAMPRPDEVVMAEGAFVEHVYFVICGEIRRNAVIRGRRSPVPSIFSGDFFGDVEVVLDSPSLFEYTSSDDTVLLRLTREEYRELLEDPNFRLQTEIEPERVQAAISETLHMIPQLSAFSVDRLAKMTKNFRVEVYEEGEVVMRENSTGNNFVLVLQGSVRATKKRKDGSQVHVFIARSGDWLGEAGILRNQPMTTTITCMERSTALVAAPDDFRTFVNRGGAGLSEIFDQGASNQVVRSIAMVPLFSEFEAHYEAIAENMLFREYEPNGIILPQGTASPGTGFFIVIHGTVAERVDEIEGLSLLQEGLSDALDSTTGSNSSSLKADDMSSGSHRSMDEMRLELARMHCLSLGFLEENDFFGHDLLLRETDFSPVSYVALTHVVCLEVPLLPFNQLLEALPLLSNILKRRAVDLSQRQKEKSDFLLTAKRAILGAVTDRNSEMLTMEGISPPDHRGLHNIPSFHLQHSNSSVNNNAKVNDLEKEVRRLKATVDMLELENQKLTQSLEYHGIAIDNQQDGEESTVMKMQSATRADNDFEESSDEEEEEES